MKKIRNIILAAAALTLFAACAEDTKDPGEPVLEPTTTFTSAYFADSLAFSANVSDAGKIALSTLKAQLFYGDEMVSEKVVRTKEYGAYSEKIYVPFHANIPDGTATLKLILQNINFGVTEEEFEVELSRPDYASVKLISGDDEYVLAKTAKNVYEITDDFPQKVKGYIEAPAFGANGNVITFGFEGGSVVEHSTGDITFSSQTAGNYTISFNTLTYAVSPQVVVKINDKELSVVDGDISAVTIGLANGDDVTFEGFGDFAEWWVNPTYLEATGEDNVFKFLPIDGNYRFIADSDLKYVNVEATDASGNPLSLQEDGTGAIWIIGDGVGMPSWSLNPVGWATEKGLCLAPMGDKKYQIVFTAGPDNDSPIGQTIKASSINFKFFHQKDWGGEFDGDAISVDSDMIYIGDGATENANQEKRDSGNLGVYKDKPMEIGSTYVFTVDVSAGNDSAVLTVEKK